MKIISAQFVVSTLGLLFVVHSTNLYAQSSANKLGDSIFDELGKQVQAQIGATAVTDYKQFAPSDFNWYYDLPTGFNDYTWTQLDSLVEMNKSTGMPELTNKSFVNAYETNVATNLTFKYSKQDQAAVDQAGKLASASAQSLIRQYESSIKPISQSDLKASGYDNKLDFIINGKILGQWAPANTTLADLKNAASLTTALPNAPASFTYIETQFADYLGDTASVTQLLDQRQNAIGKLRKLKANCLTPATKEGAIETTDLHNQKVRLAYNLTPDVGAIAKSLGGGNTVTIKVHVKRTSANDFDASINGQAIGSVGIGALFSANFSSSAAHDISQTISIGSEFDMVISWEGITIIDVHPQVFSASAGEGWFFESAIDEANTNYLQDKTGLHWLHAPSKSTTTGGLVSKLVISQYPKISITSSDKAFNSNFSATRAKAQCSVELLGFGLGGGSSKMYSANSNTNSKSGETTITFSPDTSRVFGGANLDSVANVLGGSIFNPWGN